MRATAALPLPRVAPAIYVSSLVVLLLGLGLGLLVARPAAAQTPAPSLLGYGQTGTGVITAPGRGEHYFTGCADETISLTVTADETDGKRFAPRVELYHGADERDALASAVAAAGTDTVSLNGIALPTSGPYIIVVSGRSRSDQGGYTLALTGTLDGDPLPDDSFLTLNLQYGDRVRGTIAADAAQHWNFRGCEGDEIMVELAADDFVPQLELFSPIAEFAIATAAVALTDDTASATLVRTLPANNSFNLIVSGASESDAGDYSLTLTLVGEATPHPTPTVTSTVTPTEKPAVTAVATPTPEAEATSESGPRGRRGIPNPKTTPRPEATSTVPRATPTATPTTRPTATPTATPEFIMPGVGESVFQVFEISSREGPANFVAYSPDGSVIATAGADGAVRVYSPGRLQMTLLGHTAAVNHIAFSPNGSWLASAGDDGTVRLWDEEGNEAITLEMPADDVTSVAFSPDSNSLVATTRAGDVLVWDVADQAIRLTLAGHEAPVYSAAFSPNGSSIATGDGGGVVRIWNASNGVLRQTLPVNVGPGSSDPILSVVFDNASVTVITGGVIGVNAASVQVWDVATGDPIAEFVGQREWGSTATISPDGAYIFSAGRAAPGHDGPISGSARVWNATTGELVVAFIGYQNSVIAANFSPNGDELLTSDGYNVYIWPAPMLEVFAAAYGEPIGVQVPVPTVAATATPTPTRTATPTVSPDASPTPFLPSNKLEVFCSVTIDRLNLRPGPGTNFNPPLTVLDTAAFLVAVGRNADSSWLQVVVLDDTWVVAYTGWVSADYVFCVGDLSAVPVVEVE